MNRRIFVTATNTDIGKTYTTLLLLKEYASRGVKVGAIKLIETGVLKSAPDAVLLLKTLKELNPDFKTIDINDIVPITYSLAAAPFVASNNTPLNLQKLNEAIQKLEKIADILIIEGAGGLYVPIDSNTMMIDMIVYFNANALLVTHCSLGCINDTLLSEKALKDRNINFTTAFNCRANDRSFDEVSSPYFLQTREELFKVSRDVSKICDRLI